MSTCPDKSWDGWDDTGNVEGKSSCFKFYSTGTTTWSSANSACNALGGGAHLLTVKQPQGATAIPTSLLAVVQRKVQGAAWLGATRAGTTALAGGCLLSAVNCHMSNFPL